MPAASSTTYRWLFYVGLVIAIAGAYRNVLWICVTYSSAEARVTGIIANDVFYKQDRYITLQENSEIKTVLTYNVGAQVYTYEAIEKQFRIGDQTTIHFSRYNPANAMLFTAREFIFMECWLALLFTLIWCALFHFLIGFQNVLPSKKIKLNDE